MNRLILMGASLLVLGGCILVGGRRHHPAPTGVVHDAVTAGQTEVRAKEIKARVVRARVIYAKEIKARDGRIGRHSRMERAGDWSGGPKELRADEVVADVIYAKEIHADYLEADEVYAKEVKLGR